jgi:glycosyltransferase involved in cell wall biosynthesis
MPSLSAIICTHNPRPDFLSRTLAALRAQTLAPAEWELLVIDNASRVPLAGTLDLAWHPLARVVREDEVGLTAARLRGIAEARSELTVWIDDDNLLAPDYLEVVIQLAREWPRLGVWGCGDFQPEWETPPRADYAPYLHYLAVNRAPRDRWSNLLYDFPATPAGAGLCVRADVTHRYADNVREDPRRKALGRTGKGLGACEDHDLAFTAIDLGYGTGVFLALRLTHLMPAGRVQEDYLLRLVEGHACSTVLLMALRDSSLRPNPRRWIDRLRGWRLRRSLNPIEIRIEDAKERGARRGWSVLESSRPPAASP